MFFPLYALAAFMIGSSVAALALHLAGLTNAGWLLLIKNTALYLNYELFHFCCHVKDDSIVRRIPLINTIRRHHTAHHNYGIMMSHNMNLTFPIADSVMGTNDLNRGLLGTLLNGYNEDHVQPELKPVIERFRRPDAPVTLDRPIREQLA